MKIEPCRVLVIGVDGADTNAGFNVLHRSGHRVDHACDLRDAFSGDLSEHSAIFVDDDLLDAAADVILAELRRRAPNAGVVVVASSQRDEQSLLSRFEAADDWLWRPVTANRVWLSLTHLARLRQMKQSMLDHDRLAVLGRTLAILAHEGRGLLSVSSLTLDLLALCLEDRPEMMRLTASVQSSHARLRRLFDDVYGYAAPIKLKLELCNLRERLLSVCQDLRKLDSSKHIEVIEPLGESDLCCQADPFRIDQIFWNLVQNALAACSDPIRLTACWTAAELHGSPAVQLTLRDNGPGLSDEQRLRLFEPFFTTKSNGTGLGMTIARQNVEAHGGRFELGASDSGGVEFVITFPRRATQDTTHPVAAPMYSAHELLHV